MNISATEAALQNYSFKKDKPIYSNGGYSTFAGKQIETNVPVTIKILNNYHPDLPKYLKKLKDCRSDNVIKVYETLADQKSLLFITEKVTYGNLEKALSRCERFDDSDSVFMAKLLLNGHVDLLRNDCNWFGTEKDIEITDGGVKLSWNNSISFNLVNPFPKILEKISLRSEEKAGDANLLPFPKGKSILQLIRLSRENASEISLNPQMKKKEKVLKKKGKNWIAFKQYRNKNEYFEELSYLAFSEEHGAIRVKAFDSGKIKPEILALNKNKKTFTKVLETYEENGKTLILSEYSNDGNLQAYVTKLKSSGVILNQQHIQFFFYSLFEPLKQVQESPLKSINMLHIKNIYIENGIPKIGEPIPMNGAIEQILIDRAGVPDFYCSGFKKSPMSHEQTFDTYSLGVLLYKLMYTEYPIFPNGVVHIPTTPTYNKRLRTTLEIFLNEGGKLKEIESRIEISDNVVKQVKENKEKLILEKKKQAKEKNDQTKRIIIEDHESMQELQKEEESEKDERSEQSEEGDEMGCCSVCCAHLDLTPNEELGDKNIGIAGLEESPYRIYRVCTKIFLTLILYVFLFYFNFIQNNVMLLSNQNVITEYNVTISTVTYSIITTDSNSFDNSFGTTGGTDTDFLKMNCLLNNYEGNPNYNETLYPDSGVWMGYIISSLLSLILILIMKGWQIYTLDLVRAEYNKENAKYKFNLSNYFIFSLLWASLVYGHYSFYNYIFNNHSEPCFDNKDIYAAPDALFNDYDKFRIAYIPAFGLQILSVIFHCIMIGNTHKIKYNKLVNPYLFFCPPLIGSWVILRIGAMKGYFYPNILNSPSIIKGYFTPFDYVNVLGTIPEIIFILELVLCVLIDLLYWMFLDKRRRLLINENSAASLNQI